MDETDGPFYPPEAMLPPEFATPPALEPPTAEKIASEYGCEVADIPQLFGQLLTEAAPLKPPEIHKTPDEEYQQLHALYKIWRAAQEDPELGDLAARIGSAADVQQNFPGCNVRLLASMLKACSESSFQPGGMLIFSASPERTSFGQDYGMYDIDGAWINVPAPTIVLARPAVLEEAAALEEELTAPEADIFHATSSAALPGITHNRTILSSRRAVEAGHSITTGEYLHDQHTGNTASDDIVPENVYMSNLLVTTYSTKQWFNEFPVIFGYDAVEVEDAYEQRYGYRKNFRSANAPGHEVGDELPLEKARAVYVPADKLPEIQEWLDEFAPPGPRHFHRSRHHYA